MTAASGGAAAGGPASGASVYAYLADNTVVRANATLTAWKVTRIGKRPSAASTGHLLAQSLNGDVVWALVRSEHRLVALTHDLRPRRSVALPRDWSARGIAIGQKTGRIYIAYDIETAVPKRHDPPQSARLAIFTADGERRLQDALLRPSGRRSWRVWSLSLSSDETRAYISYHGSDTTGLDAVTIDGTTIRNCRGGDASHGLGCWTHPHGRAVATGTEVVATTGSQTIEVYDPDSTLIRKLDTGLENNHLMEFALDGSGDRLFAAGSCGYVRGFSVLEYTTGARLRLTHARALCGQMVAFAGGDDVIVGKTALPVPDPRLPGRLLRVDANTATVVATHTTPSEPTDIIAVP